MKRSYVCLLMILVLTLSLLVGCGSTGTQSSGKDQSTVEGNGAGATAASGTEATAEANTTETGTNDEANTTEAVPADTNTTETGTSTETQVAEGAELIAEFEPNKDYDKYALVDYLVEDIAAQFVATVSAKEDDSEFEVHCSIDGEEQIVTLDKDLNIVTDQTGNMSYDAPLIVQNAIDNNNWIKIEK